MSGDRKDLEQVAQTMRAIGDDLDQFQALVGRLVRAANGRAGDDVTQAAQEIDAISQALTRLTEFVELVRRGPGDNAPAWEREKAAALAGIARIRPDAASSGDLELF